MLKILHITGHLGGGVGTVVLNYLQHKASVDTGQVHKVISLHYINETAEVLLRSIGVEHYSDCHKDHKLIAGHIFDSDIVLLHWWNHPLISDWLIRGILPPCRLAIWSHISGSISPNNFCERLFQYPDRFIFTTPLSFFDQEFSMLTAQERERFGVIWSTGGIERLDPISLHPGGSFNVGYIGNLDYAKIHPRFVSMSEAIDIPNVRFTIVGPANDRLTSELAESSIRDKVRITGYLPENEKWAELEKFDVFGYPLASHHYGTCDQALQEAMAVGVTPIVMSNAMEGHMVQHGETGLIAHTTEQYSDFVRLLYTDRSLRGRLSINAKQFARSEFSLTRMSKLWDLEFSNLHCVEKSKKYWNESENCALFEPHQVFIESLGRHGACFSNYLNPIYMSREKTESHICSLGGKLHWQSRDKSSVHQWSKFFPQDLILKRLSMLMDNISG